LPTPGCTFMKNCMHHIYPYILYTSITCCRFLCSQPLSKSRVGSSATWLARASAAATLASQRELLARGLRRANCSEPVQFLFWKRHAIPMCPTRSEVRK
jgi:hypothetical protein